jgi:hypothetical protein
MSVKKMLDAKDEFELQILSNYKNILDDVFKFTYKVDGRVNWERITRFSPSSNFVSVSGIAELPDDYVIVDENDKETQMPVNFIIPIVALDDGSTASDISKHAQRIGTFRAILGNDVDAYFDILTDAESTMDDVNRIVNKYDASEDVPLSAKIVPIFTKDTPILVGFDMDELTDEQLTSLALHTEISKQ